MEQNKNIPTSHFECKIPGLQQTMLGPSVFAIQNLQAYIESEPINRAKSFSEFISARTQYLNSLKTLGNDWMSSPSLQPTEESISLSKDLLASLNHWYTHSGYTNFVYPKVIMGPTPSGGVGMEIELFPDLRAFVTILDDKIEYDVEKNGYYSEYKVDKNNITNELLALYNSDKAIAQMP